MSQQDVKDLTFYMGDKTDDELWAIVRESCRGSTPTWRAYERLHGQYCAMRRRINQYEKTGEING